MSRFHNSSLVIRSIKIDKQDSAAADKRIKNFSRLMRTLLRMYLRGEIKNVKYEELKVTEY